jgi:hypothetical protein
MEQFDELREQLKRLMPANDNHAVIIPPSYKLAANLIKALAHAGVLLKQVDGLREELRQVTEQRDALLATIEMALAAAFSEEVQP